MMSNSDERKAQLAGLLETLTLLVAQARAHDRALPPDNYLARAAVAAMAQLAQQALNEAQDLAARLEAPASPLSLDQLLELAAKMRPD